jgi:hypothetical protein
MARHTTPPSSSGEFGLDYNAGNGRVTALYGTDPRGLTGRIVLDDGTVAEGSLRAGGSLAVPGNRARLTFGPDDEGRPSWTLTGVASLTFHRGP